MTGGLKISLLLAALLLIVSQYDVSGYEVKVVERLKFDQSQEAVQFPRDICLTEDGLFLISDQHAGDVKIYSREAETLRLVGKIGGGEADNDDLKYPTYCFYNRDESKLGLIDFTKKKILLYDRLGKMNFLLNQEINCPYKADGILLSGNKLFISGFTLDSRNNGYDLYAVDLNSSQVTSLLHSYYKYGLNSPAEYEEKYLRSDEIRALGISGWLAAQSGYIYFSWEGDLKILKIDAETGKIVKTFGKRTFFYKKPAAPTRLLQAYRDQNAEILREEKNRMSFVRHLFTDDEYVYVVYEGPVKREDNGKSNFRIQIYTLSGTFLDDVFIPGQPGRVMCFDADQRSLYSIAEEPGQKEYSILKYSMHK